MESPNQAKEFKRILELSEFDFDYSISDNQFDDLLKLSASIADTSISMISIIDSYRNWVIAQQGINIESIPREESICRFTLLSDNHLEITELSKDDRFNERFYTTEKQDLNYYLGIPLKTKAGNTIGTLSVMDSNSKTLSSEKIKQLKIIAREIIQRIESNKQVHALENKIENLAKSHRKVSHDIRGPLSGIIGLSEMIKEQGEDNDLDEILEMMDLIHDGGQSLLVLADKILGVSEQRTSYRNEFTLQTLQQKLTQIYLAQAKMKGVQLDVVISEDTLDVPFQKDKILQISGNLLSNAIYGSSEKGLIDVLIRLQNGEKSNELYICLGVDTHKLKLDITRNGNGEMTNATAVEQQSEQGLNLVKHIIDTLHGTFDIKPMNKGFQVEVTLPI